MDQNPFECSCDLLWFQSWMIRAPALFKSVGYGRYWCQNLQNTTVQQFYLQPQTCLLKKSNSILIISFVCFALFLLSVIIGLFGYRWQLRLWLYAVCHGGSNKRRRLAERQAWRFQYDVFVAYAEEDVEWLLKELLPVLEERLGLRVCIHQRDFVPGKHILDNISDCVEASDRILMVLSPNFARSMWCQFELKFCQRVVMAREDVLVLVMLQETESRDMSGAMLAVLQTTTYIEWADQNPARESFWGRLELVLRDIAR